MSDKIRTQFQKITGISDIVVINSLKDNGKVSQVITKDGNFVLKFQETEQEKFEVTSSERMNNEIAMASFLNRINPDITAKLAGHDVKNGVIIYEDLGCTRTIMDLLEDQSTDAEEVLTRMYKMFGSFHGHNYTDKQLFTKLQSSFSARTPQSDSTLDLRTKMNDIQDFLKHLGYSTSEIDVCTNAIVEIEKLLFDQSEFVTVIHADSGPQNVISCSDQFFLVDLEFGSYGTFSQDVVGHRLGFPQSWRGKRIPKELHSKLERAHYDEFSQHVDITWGQYCEYLDASSLHWILNRLVQVWLHMIKQTTEMSEERGELISRKIHTIIDGALDLNLSDDWNNLFTRTKSAIEQVLPYRKGNYFPCIL